jgi:type II secretory ATPase GspE/PulE/Tfp pilus assembly ATPase PilB-like protein
MPSNRLGELLIQSRLITDQQFAQALEMQKSCLDQPIGQLLVQLGFLRESVLMDFLDYKGKRQKLGEILIRRKLINEFKLHNALTVSRDDKIPLGKALIKLFYIEECQLAQAIAHQYDLPYFTLDQFSFDPELSRLINFKYAHTNRIAPAARYEKTLTVAMAFPLDAEEMRAIQIASGMKINPVVATEGDIVRAQQRVYRTRVDVTARESEERIKIDISEDREQDRIESKYMDQYYGPETDGLVGRVLSLGIKERASDIHLENGENGMIVRYRVDGILRAFNMDKDGPVIRSQPKPLISRIKILCGMDIAEKRRPQDGSFKIKVTHNGSVRRIDFRVSTVPTQHGENVMIRILDQRILPTSLEDLGLSVNHLNALTRELEKPTGIFLVTGPTGSGKSTTLYSLLTKLNTPGVKTLTVEDPIEYSINGLCQSEVNEAAGITFAKLLRSLLRQDPDIIMVGEIRDVETAEIAMRAALTGHAVLSTLHTNDATSAVMRLQDMGLEPTLISSTLRCVLAQRLVRVVCAQCKVRQEPADHLKREFFMTPGTSMEFVYGKGCVLCNYTGYSGRRPITEMWVPTRKEIIQINRRSDNLSLRDIVFNHGRRPTLVEDGLALVKQGITTLDELMHVVPYEQIAEFHSRIGKKQGDMKMHFD